MPLEPVSSACDYLTYVYCTAPYDVPASKLVGDPVFFLKLALALPLPRVVCCFKYTLIRNKGLPIHCVCLLSEKWHWHSATSSGGAPGYHVSPFLTPHQGFVPEPPIQCLLATIP